MALQVLINNIDRTIEMSPDVYDLEENITDQPDIFNFKYVFYGSKTYIPEVLDEVEVYDGGIKVFGGNIMEVSMSGSSPTRVVYNVTCIDYSHVMDRRLVVERFTARPVVNIINEIMNRYINKDTTLEVSSFEDTEIWSAGSADTDHFATGSQGWKLTSTNLSTTVANRTVNLNLQPLGFASSDFVDVDIYVDQVSNLDEALLRIGDGATATNYFEFDVTSLLSNGRNRIHLEKADAVAVGSPSWTAVTGLQLRVTAIASNTVEVTFDNWNVTTFESFTNINSQRAIQEVNYIAFNYLEPSKCFQKMAELFNWNWYVDDEKDIHFFDKFDEPAPFDLNDGNLPTEGGNYIYKSLELVSSADQVRNGIYVRGGDYLAPQINDTLTNQADGANKIFLLGYKYSDYELEVAGNRMGVGIDNIDAFTNNLAGNQTSIGTALQVGDSTSNSFVGQQVLVTSHGRRSAVTIRIRKVGNPVDDFRLRIFSTNSTNLPVNPPLSSAYVDLAGTGITTSFAEYTFALAELTPGTLLFDAGDSYSIVVTRSGAVDPVNYYEVDAASQGEYDGKGAVHNGSIWGFNNAALFFKEFSNFEVLYNFQEKIITFATAPAALTTIIWTGRPYKPVLVLVNNYSSIAEFGVYQFRVLDPSIKSNTAAVQRANQELLAFSEALISGSFTTYRPGLHAGMTVTLESPSRGILPEEYLIRRVAATLHTNSACEYQVTIASKRTLGLIYFLQQQLMNASNNDVVNDDEILEKVENIFEVETVTDSISTAQNPIRVWSNSAGTTPNHNVWSGGANYQWQP